MAAILHYNGDYAVLAVQDDFGEVNELETCRLHADRYVRINDGQQYPQLCEGASFHGATITAHPERSKIGPALARDCHARYYKTRAGYDRALARLRS